jgi:hypothetical protein
MEYDGVYHTQIETTKIQVIISIEIHVGSTRLFVDMIVRPYIETCPFL